MINIIYLIFSFFCFQAEAFMDFRFHLGSGVVSPGELNDLVTVPGTDFNTISSAGADLIYNSSRFPIGIRYEYFNRYIQAIGRDISGNVLDYTLEIPSSVVSVLAGIYLYKSDSQPSTSSYGRRGSAQPSYSFYDEIRVALMFQYGLNETNEIKETAVLNNTTTKTFLKAKTAYTYGAFLDINYIRSIFTGGLEIGYQQRLSSNFQDSAGTLLYNRQGSVLQHNLSGVEVKAYFGFSF